MECLNFLIVPQQPFHVAIIVKALLKILDN